MREGEKKDEFTRPAKRLFPADNHKRGRKDLFAVTTNLRKEVKRNL